MLVDVTSGAVSDARPAARHHMESDLEALEQEVRELAELVRTALGLAMQALVSQDRRQRQAIIHGDREIDRRYLGVEQPGFATVARHAPVAGEPGGVHPPGPGRRLRCRTNLVLL